MDGINVTLPLKNEYLTTVRLLTGGVCAVAEFDVDFAEDVKVCVTESLLILKRNGYSLAELSFGVGETLRVQIVGKERKDAANKEEGDEISLALLDALIGGVRFEKDADGVICGINFEV